MMKIRFQITKESDMNKLTKIIVIFCVTVLMVSCGIFQTSMTPSEVYDTLPTYTQTKFLTEAQVQKMDCRCLTRNRSYTAPIGLTVKNDLKNGAKGIDEWVILDGGNSYVLKNYQWMTVGFNSQNGTSATQLYVEFDTYICE